METFTDLYHIVCGGKTRTDMFITCCEMHKANKTLSDLHHIVYGGK